MKPLVSHHANARAIEPRLKTVASAFAGCLLAAALAVFAMNASRAQGLDIGPGAATGFLVMGVFPEGEINGETVRFSPAARIHGEGNRLVLPASIANQRQRIAFTRDPQGLVNQVWLITAEQARALAAARNR